MQITRLRYTLPCRRGGNASRARSRARRPPSSVLHLVTTVSVTAQHLEISERVNYGPATGNDGGAGGRG